MDAASDHCQAASQEAYAMSRHARRRRWKKASRRMASLRRVASELRKIGRVFLDEMIPSRRSWWSLFQLAEARHAAEQNPTPRSRA